ncbi:MAG TPA: PAS domain-containing protein [Nitrospiraceae bacterium]|nr:PAS domain-containing protein [Nitrospiraceae bacterium]
MALQVREQRRNSKGSTKRSARRSLHGCDERAWPIQTVIDAYQTSVAVLDHRGVIRYVNGAWCRFARANGLRSKACGVGLNYLDLCRQTHIHNAGSARTIARKINSLLTGTSSKFTYRYLCDACAKQQRCVLRGSRLKEAGRASASWILLSDEHIIPARPLLTALRELDQRLEELMQSTHMIPWEADAETWRMTYVGPQVAALLGYPPDQWYEPGFWVAHLHPDDREHTVDRCRQLSRQQSHFELRYRMIARDGRPVWLLDIVTVIGSLNRPRTLRGFFLDVSAEAHRHERETLLRLLLESIDEIFWFIRVKPERLVYISPAVETITGRKAEEFYGDTRFWRKCVHEQDRDRVEQAYAAWLAGEVSDYREQYRVSLPNGTVRWFDEHGTLMRDPEGRISFATGIAKDITEQKHNEEILRRLSARLITAQEAERSRIARELHDHVNQTLALLSVELEQFGRVPFSYPGRQDAMEAMQQQLKTLSSDIHAMSHRLHPSKLKHLGLVSAIRALCRDMEESGLHVRFADRDIPRTLPDDVALTLYRVAQEGLHNVRKHSGTDSVDLTLTKPSTSVTLRLRDKGRGFDPGLLECGDGLGLVSMAERVGSVGGTLAIRSAPGAGSEIEVRIPIRPERDLE